MIHPTEQLKLFKDAGDLLAEKFQTFFAITNVELVKDGANTQTYRLSLSSPDPKIPHSVIVKRIKSTADSHKGYNDWGCLEFLSAARQTRALIPTFYAGSEAAALYSFEDLGPTVSMDDAWKPNQEKDEIFIEHAKASAELAALTGLREVEFEHLLTALPVPQTKKRYADADVWRENLPKFKSWFSALNLSEHDLLDSELAKLAQCFEDPGRLLAFSHGDFAPTNLHVNPDTRQVRMIDFEYGAFRNALYDLSAWNILCPLRDELVQKMRETYKTQFIAKYEFSIGAAEIDRAWFAMSLYRAVSIFSWIDVDVIKTDKAWAGEWTCRLALLSAAQRGAQVALEANEYPALYNVFEKLNQRLKELWAQVQN